MKYIINLNAIQDATSDLRHYEQMILNAQAHMERCRSPRGIAAAEKDIALYTEWKNETEQKIAMLEARHNAATAALANGDMEIAVAHSGALDTEGRRWSEYDYKLYTTLDEAMAACDKLNTGYDKAHIEILPKNTVVRIKELRTIIRNATLELEKLEKGE